MSANVESMFYAGREKPWHGLGTQVEEAPTSADALPLMCGAVTVRCWAWSVTGIRWCRMRRHLRSPTL